MAPSAISPPLRAHNPISDSQTAQQQLLSWVDQLRGSRPAELFHGRAGLSCSKAERTRKHEFIMEASLWRELQEFCASTEHEERSVLLAAFRAAQYRLNGASDANIGVAHTGRENHDKLDGATAADVALHCIRTTIESDTCFADLLQQVSDRLHMASSNPDISLETIAAALYPDQRASLHDLVKVLVSIHRQKPCDIPVQQAGGTGSSKRGFEIECHTWTEDEQLCGHVLYDTHCFGKESIASLVSTFCDLLQTGLNDLNAPISKLPLTSGLSRVTRDASCASVIASHHVSVYDAFREQVAAYPDQLAVKDRSEELTYAQLDHLAHKVSTWLSKRDYAAETIVGVLAGRSVEAIVLYMGILAANYAYVPLDTKSPAERLNYMLSSIGSRPLVLCGKGVDLVASQLEAECLTLSRVLDESDDWTPVDHMLPMPTTLAAVIFTSGSTGRPKGVAIEHHSIVRVAKQKSYQIPIDASGANPVVSHLLNPAFDAAMMEIYTALLNGSMLYCVVESTILDSRALSEAFEREKVRMAVFTPSLLDHYLREAPLLFSQLQVLVVGGDRFRTSHARQLKRLIRGEVFNGYGPTENTVVSTLYSISSNDLQLADDVPIGQAVTGSIACVVDQQQRLVPPGVIGELIVAGDGLARGYLDSNLDVGRFVHVDIDGKTVRAYRTGDLARLQPDDMQLQFMGRIDTQVKIRGHRIEVAEIDKALLEHPVVGDAATILHSAETGEEPSLVSFVTKSPDRTYADLSSKVTQASLGRDFFGWNSMYDGSAIPEEEMTEWLEDTIETIVNSSPNGEIGRVLEIGTGSGMMLFNLAPQSQQYVGLEPSLDAVNFVNSALKSFTNFGEKARVHQGAAATVGRWMNDCQPDLIVVNSVSQYFPSAEYLYKVIEDCVQQLQPRQETRLFFGDVRSYALHQEFLVHKALHNNADHKVSIAEVRSIVQDQANVERELLVDPAFFTALPTKLNGSVEHVEILPKRMRATNELSCYRYGAIVHLRGSEAKPMQVRSPSAWVEATRHNVDRDSLLQRLTQLSEASASSDIVLALSRIPNSKINFDTLAVDAMQSRHNSEDHDLDWVASVRTRASNSHAFDVPDLLDLARAADLAVEVSWARQYSQRGGFDAVFYRRTNLPDEKLTRTLFSFPTDHDLSVSRALCNKPLRAATRDALQYQLETLARDSLPLYMMPKAVFVIDKMPLTNNGKLNKEALAKTAEAEFAAAVKRDSTRTMVVRRPGSDVEAKLKEVWALVLKVPVASLAADDHFVRKGGDSIKAMRLMAEARRKGLIISIPDILTSPRLCDMASRVSEEVETPETASASIPRNDVQPFELLKQTDEDEARNLAAAQCEIQADIIEDIFPCTPLQAGLAALNMANPSDYISRTIKELLPDIDVDRFQRAFEHVVQVHPILRTRIVYLPGEGIVQLTARETIPWRSGSSVEDYIETDRQDLMGLGKPLVRAAIVREESRRFFVLTMLHSVFDGWTLKILFDALDQAYRGLSLQAPPLFQSFIKALVKHNDSETGKQAWITNLMGNEAEQSPHLPSPNYRPVSNAVHSRRLHSLGWGRMDVTASVAVRGALAIMTCQRENVQDVIFGTTVTGRNSIQVPGIELMSGPTITTIPTRATLSRQDETVGDLLVRLQAEWANLATFEHMGISAIRDLSDDAARATTFQTLLVVQPADESQEENRASLFKHEANIRVADNDLGAISTYAMVMECELYTDGLNIRVTFDSHVIPEAHMNRMLSQYEAILRKLCLPAVCEQRLPEVEWLSDLDIRDIWTWNATMPEAVDSAVHNLLSPIFHRQPDAEAICAWDGSLTYQELDTLSTQLACLILNKGILDSYTIPIFMEKSKWTSITMLAIMKAGGTSCLLDPTLPASRLQSIVKQLQPKIILTSPQQSQTATSLFDGEVINVSLANTMHWPTTLPDQGLPVVSPTTPLYIVFTSGSTGVPKGVIISHQSFSSAIFHQSPRRTIGQHSRVLDFSSLAFDGSWFNLLHTLYAGGCVCVPSETGRRDDLKGSILELKANFAFLTPTVASTLDAEALKALESLEIGGEAADEEEMQRIQRHTRVRFIYGPSECTPITTLTELGAHALSIGRAAGVLPWLVDPQVPHRLVGVGCVAELWLEGPLVGSGYYNDEKRTAASFVENPAWMLRDRHGQPGRKGRAYRTGDLVRYHPDGHMEFVGRNNTQQVKIRGQRVELLDVQHHVQNSLRKCQPEVQVIADVGGEKDGILVAFICVPSKSWIATSFDLRLSRLTQMAGNIKEELAGAIPTYMIPSLFIPVQSFPMGHTGKLDRRKLRAIMDEMSPEQCDECHLDPNQITSASSKPRTPMEKRFRSLWATALKIDADTITVEDSFFHRGGDSISAMRLVNLARKDNIHLGVREVWDHPRLHELAAHLSRSDSAMPSPPATVESFPRHLETAPISEVLPVTCSQYQFLNGTSNGYSSHIYHLLVDLPPSLTADHVKKACEKWTQYFDILRTRFICTPQRICQVIDREIELPWNYVEHTEGSEEDLITRTCEADRDDLGRLPSPQSCMTRFFLFGNQHGPQKLVVRLGHAQYDGFSLPRMLSTLTELLNERVSTMPRPFAEYIRHILSQNPNSYQYWRNLLQGTQSPTVIQPTHHQAAVDVQLLTVGKTITQPAIKDAASTPAVQFLAACAAMLAQTTYNDDVVFGCIVSGRRGVPPELQDVCGPCLNEIPVRVTFPDGDAAPQTVVEQLRNQILECSAHETVGFDEIAAHCTSWPSDVEDFGLTAHYQNSDDIHLDNSEQVESSEDGTQFPCSLVESQRPDRAPVPKANYIEVEAIPLPNNQIRISIMGKSSEYKLRFLEQLLGKVCSNYSV